MVNGNFSFVVLKIQFLNNFRGQWQFFFCGLEYGYGLTSCFEYMVSWLTSAPFILWLFLGCCGPETFTFVQTVVFIPISGLPVIFYLDFYLFLSHSIASCLYRFGSVGHYGQFMWFILDSWPKFQVVVRWWKVSLLK